MEIFRPALAGLLLAHSLYSSSVDPDQLPGDSWIHFCNSYLKFTCFFFIKGIIFC